MFFKVARAQIYKFLSAAVNVRQIVEGFSVIFEWDQRDETGSLFDRIGCEVHLGGLNGVKEAREKHRFSLEVFPPKFNVPGLEILLYAVELSNTIEEEIG